MEVRKLQTTAGGTFMVTVPRDWVEKLGLKKGDHLSVEREGNNIILSSSASVSPERRPLEISGFREMKMLDLCVTAAYMVGHDVTEVVSGRKMAPEQKRWTREAVEHLLGLEISEEYSDQMILQNFIDPMKFDAFRMFERFSAASIAVLSDSVKALADADPSLAQDAFERGGDSTKNYRLLYRLALQCSNDKRLRVHMNLPNVTSAVVFLQSVRELGRAAYYSMRIAQHVLELKRRPASALIDAIAEMARMAASMQEQAAAALMGRNVEIASAVIDRLDRVRKLNEGAYLLLFRERDEKSSMAISQIVRDIRNIASHASALAEDAALFAFA